jgi:hypothetical protein
MLLRTRRLDFDTTKIKPIYCSARTEGGTKEIKLRNMLEIQALYMKIDVKNCWTLKVKGPFDMKIVQSLFPSRNSHHFRELNGD